MKKKFFIILLLVTLFIPLTVFARNSDDDSVEADDSKNDDYVECWYKEDSIYYFYNKTSNEFKSSINGTGGYLEFENTLIRSNFINIDKQLYCPMIYVTAETVNGRQVKYTTYIEKPSDSVSSSEYKPSKTNIHNNKNSNIKYETCVYSSGTQKIEFVLDINSKLILSSQIDAKDVNINQFTYEEIWKDGKCADIKEIYASCYDGSRGWHCGM